MDATKAAALIANNGVWGLGGYDGCLCTDFCVQSVHVSIACRKSSDLFPDFYGNVIRVHSEHMDSTVVGLGRVAEIVLAQVKGHEPHLPVKLRFCSYEQDKGLKCLYCGNVRELEKYLCATCQVAENRYGPGRIADQYDYGALLVSRTLEVSENG